MHVAICLFTGCALALIIAHTGHNDHGDVVAGFAAGIIRTTFGFCAGMLIARRAPTVGRRPSNGRFLAIVAVVIIMIAIRVNAHWRPIWDILCVLVVFPLVVHAGVRVDPVGRLRTAATFLGSTSYAIYVLHDPLTGVLNSLTRKHASWALSQAGIPFPGIAIIVVLLAGCWFVDRFYDAPMRRFLGRIAPRFLGLPLKV